MKTLVIAATALSLIAGAAVAQPYGGYNDHRSGYTQDRYDRNDRDGRRDRYDNNSRYDRYERRESRRWSRGDRLPSSYRSSRYAVDYRRHHLRAPPRGYRWQRVDDNYVLAAIATGLIAEIISGR